MALNTSQFMWITDIKALPPLTAPRLLGLDVGTKTIGLALSDMRRTIATPMETIARSKFTTDAQKLKEICDKQDVGALVIGYPRNMDGSEGSRAQATRSFIRELEKTLPLPMVLWDERLSTSAVTRTMLDADLSRARRSELVDKLAAAYILQGALDALGAR